MPRAKIDCDLAGSEIRELGYAVFDGTRSTIEAMTKIGMFDQAADVLRASEVFIEALRTVHGGDFLFP